MLKIQRYHTSQKKKYYMIIRKNKIFKEFPKILMQFLMFINAI